MRVLLIGGGYVGSRLVEHFGTHWDVCDERGDPALVRFPCRYQELSARDVMHYTDVLWFAGHSSVRQAVADPDGAIRNNCLDLYDFATRLPADCRFIYASSASLYSFEHGSEQGIPHSATEDDEIIPNANEYDISKFAFDYVARTFLRRFVGLRMGTVSGYAPQLRRDLVFNAMNLSASESGEVLVSNRHAWRSLLFLDDLVELVDRLLADKREFTGFLNAASVSMPIGELAAAIARFHGVPISETPDTPTYSFRLGTGRMDALLGRRVSSDLATQCHKFVGSMTSEAM